MFHIIRAFHVAGRCTDCGECSRVCPQHIPLHLLNRKFIKDINEFYGDYQAGEEVEQPRPAGQLHSGRSGALRSPWKGGITMSKVRKVCLAKLDEFFCRHCRTARRLYLPVDTARQARNTRNGPRERKWSDALNTVRSAKDFFFPQTENLMDFKMQGKKIELIDTRRETEDFVVFGVRACDARSLPRAGQRVPGRAGGYLLPEPPEARHHRHRGLHPPGGDLLLQHLRHRPGQRRRRCERLQWRKTRSICRP